VRQFGDLIILIGVLVVLVGVVMRFGAFSWFGHLPGDIRLGGDNWTVFLPITSMIVVSIVLTVVVNLLLRLFK
jgi:uncharacterized membrane protein